MNFHSIPFGDDLLKTAIGMVSDPGTLVFATQAAAGKAWRIWQNSWQMQDCPFMSMETLKRHMIRMPMPCVQDEKRLLCLYHVLDDEDKAFLQIHAYDDLITWGNQFFKFLEELCDECFPLDALTELVDSPLLNLMEWQEKSLIRIVDILNKYLQYVQALGFGDAIQYINEQHFEIPAQHRHYVFVNQYYFSKLEIALIRRLEADGHKVTVLHQGPKDSFDPIAMRSKAIALATLSPEDYRVRQIQINQCETEEQAILAFLADNGGQADQLEGMGVIVDSGFAGKHYSAWFDPARYVYPLAMPIQNTGLYQFMLILHNHMELLSNDREHSFLPIAAILNALASPDFIRYYRPEWSPEAVQEALSGIKGLIGADVLYIDLALDIFDHVDYRKFGGLCRELLEDHFRLLKALCGIRSIADLVALCDADPGLSLPAMCRRHPFEASELPTQYYERLANFASIGALGIVPSWIPLFGEDGHKVACGIFKLWLDYLASVRVSVPKTADNPAWEISNLLDTRNMTYERAVFFNAVEGVLPSNPESVWLLNEAQRGKLGLKTFNQVRDWERYYFLRVLLGSHTARIYCHQNQEKDIEPGSFVTELRHALQNQELPEVELQDRAFKVPMTLLHQATLQSPAAEILPPRNTAEFGLEVNDPDSFFTIPCSPEDDFSNGKAIRSGFYNLNLLDENPMVWYINAVAKLPQLSLPPEETITPKLFGDFMHKFLSSILGNLTAEGTGLRQVRDVFTDTDTLTKLLADLIDEPKYRYCLPRNYNRDFLASVISDCLVRSVQSFYAQYLKSVLQEGNFTLLPESDEQRAEEKDYQTLGTFGGESQYQLQIKGRADLRIETPSRHIIVDFKTGNADPDQLAFYSFVYYLLRDDYDGKEINTLFWQILAETKDTKTTSSDKTRKWRERILQVLEDVLKSGYTIAATATGRKKLSAITRGDKYRLGMGREA